MFKIERLAKHHNRTVFDCGNDDLNRYLQAMASQHHKKGVARTHILTNSDDEILGFYTLTASTSQNPNIKGFPNNLPCLLLGRLGVSIHHQKQGHAQRLIINAIEHAQSVSVNVGVCFLIVDLKHLGLIPFYEQFGFKSFDDSLRMYLRIENKQ